MALQPGEHEGLADTPGPRQSIFRGSLAPSRWSIERWTANAAGVWAFGVIDDRSGTLHRRFDDQRKYRLGRDALLPTDFSYAVQIPSYSLGISCNFRRELDGSVHRDVRLRNRHC